MNGQQRFGSIYHGLSQCTAVYLIARVTLLAAISGGCSTSSDASPQSTDALPQPTDIAPLQSYALPSTANGMANTNQPQDLLSFVNGWSTKWLQPLVVSMPPGPLRLLSTLDLVTTAGKPNVYTVIGVDGDFYIVFAEKIVQYYNYEHAARLRILRLSDEGQLLWQTQNVIFAEDVKGPTQPLPIPNSVAALRDGGVEVFMGTFEVFDVSAAGEIGLTHKLTHSSDFYAESSVLTPLATRWVVADTAMPKVAQRVLIYDAARNPIREIFAPEFMPSDAATPGKWDSVYLLASNGDAVAVIARSCNPDACGGTHSMVYDARGQPLWKPARELSTLQTGADGSLWTVEAAPVGKPGATPDQWVCHRQRDGTLVAEMQLPPAWHLDLGIVPRLLVLDFARCVLGSNYDISTVILDMVQEKTSIIKGVWPITVDAAGDLLGDAFLAAPDGKGGKQVFGPRTQLLQMPATMPLTTDLMAAAHSLGFRRAVVC